MSKGEKKKAVRKKYNDSEKGKTTNRKYRESVKGKEVQKAAKKKYNKSEHGKKTLKEKGKIYRASEKGAKWNKEYFQLESTKIKQSARRKKVYKTIEGRASALFHAAKRRANKNGRKFEITKEWVIEKLNKGVCEVTGTQFSDKNEGHKNAPYAPSLDRKNSKLGYTKRNTQLVCCFFNVLKWDWNRKTVIEILGILKTI